MSNSDTESNEAKPHKFITTPAKGILNSTVTHCEYCGLLVSGNLTGIQMRENQVKAEKPCPNGVRI